MKNVYLYIIKLNYSNEIYINDNYQLTKTDGVPWGGQNNYWRFECGLEWGGEVKLVTKLDPQFLRPHPLSMVNGLLHYNGKQLQDG